MSKYFLTTIKFLAFLGLGILLCWLAVRGLNESDKAHIIKSISEANYSWILLSMLAGILAHFSRAIRWRMLITPLGYKPKLSNTFYAVMIGYLANLAIPRLGEVLRCGVLKRYEKIPLTQSFGTVIAERIIDLFLLVVFFILSAWIEYQKMHAFISENIIHPLKIKLNAIAGNTTTLLLLSGGLIIVVILFILYKKKISQNTFIQKIRGLMSSFLAGTKTVANVKSPFWFIFHTLFIWAMYLSAVYVCVFAFTETNSMTLADALVLMAIGSLGVIATPGGIGAYQWIVLQIMILWGYSTAMGVAFGWIVWLAQTILILIVGLLSFGLLAINNKEE